MTCEEFLRLLDADEGWDQGEAAAHAAVCPSCTAAARRMEAAASAFRAMREDEPPPFLATRVLARVREEAAQVPWWQRLLSPRAAWAGPLVAIAVVVVLGGYGLKRGFGPDRPAAPQTQAPLLRNEASDGRAKKSEGAAQTPSGVPVEAGATAPSAPEKGAAEPGAAPGPGGLFAPEPPADLPAAGPVAERMEAKQGLEYESAPVEPATPPFLGAAVQPQPGDRPVRSGVAAPAPAAAPPPPAPADSERLRKEKSQEEATAPTGKDEAWIEADSLAASPTEGPALCSLRSESGRFTLVQLAREFAPPGDVAWSVVVKPDGTLLVRDASGTPSKESAEALQSALGTLRLEPGRYTLVRRP